MMELLTVMRRPVDCSLSSHILEEVERLRRASPSSCSRLAAGDFATSAG
jgi:hypothetical protein